MRWYNQGPLPQDGSLHPWVGPDYDAKMTPIKNEFNHITAQYENLLQFPGLIEAEPSSKHPSTLFLCTKCTLPCPQPQDGEHMHSLTCGPVRARAGSILNFLEPKVNTKCLVVEMKLGTDADSVHSR